MLLWPQGAGILAVSGLTGRPQFFDCGESVRKLVAIR